MRMDKYVVCSKIGEGSFSEVLKARVISDNTNETSYVAIKCLKSEHPIDEHIDPNLSSGYESKEVVVLKQLNPHSNVIELIDAFHDTKTKKLCIVTELMDMNLFEYLQLYNGAALSECLVKRLMYQALCGISHLHENNLFHRDIKPENLLISQDKLILKLGDFGSCRNTVSASPFTEYIATRWYRAPECLLTSGQYTYKIDLWSIGCVMYELLAAKPLFPGRDEIDQLHYIEKILGPLPHYSNNALADIKQMMNQTGYLSHTYPCLKKNKIESSFCIKRLLPHCSPEGIDLLHSLLLYNPITRVSAKTALKHCFFDSLRAPLLQRYIYPTLQKWKKSSSWVKHHQSMTQELQTRDLFNYTMDKDYTDTVALKDLRLYNSSTPNYDPEKGFRLESGDKILTHTRRFRLNTNRSYHNIKNYSIKDHKHMHQDITHELSQLPYDELIPLMSHKDSVLFNPLYSSSVTPPGFEKSLRFNNNSELKQSCVISSDCISTCSFTDDGNDNNNNNPVLESITTTPLNHIIHDPCVLTINLNNLQQCTITYTLSASNRIKLFIPPKPHVDAHTQLNIISPIIDQSLSLPASQYYFLRNPLYMMYKRLRSYKKK